MVLYQQLVITLSTELHPKDGYKTFFRCGLQRKKKVVSNSNKKVQGVIVSWSFNFTADSFAWEAI